MLAAFATWQSTVTVQSSKAPLLGKPAPGFSFVPKHKSNSYSAESAVALASSQAASYDDDVEENG